MAALPARIIRGMRRTSFGSRGEGWVIAQFILIPVLLFAVYRWPLHLAWPSAVIWIGRGLGVVIAVFAAWLALHGVRDLGRNLTPNPKPIEDGQLVQTGTYALVRHPIYAGLILGMLALGLLFNTLTGLLASGVLFLFFDLKARQEERWLSEKYADYAAYRRRTRKLIPFIY